MSDEPLTLTALPYDEALRLDRLYRKGEPEGLDFFAKLRDGDGECFFCGTALAPGVGIAAIIEDPRSRGMAMIGRQCPGCTALPKQVQFAKFFKLMKAMYPGYHGRGRVWGR